MFQVTARLATGVFPEWIDLILIQITSQLTMKHVITGRSLDTEVRGSI